MAKHHSTFETFKSLKVTLSFPFVDRTIGTNGPLELPCTQLDHMENNLSACNDVHIQ